MFRKLFTRDKPKRPAPSPLEQPAQRAREVELPSWATYVGIAADAERRGDMRGAETAYANAYARADAGPRSDTWTRGQAAREWAAFLRRHGRPHDGLRVLDNARASSLRGLGSYSVQSVRWDCLVDLDQVATVVSEVGAASLSPLTPTGVLLGLAKDALKKGRPATARALLDGMDRIAEQKPRLRKPAKHARATVLDAMGQRDDAAQLWQQLIADKYRPPEVLRGYSLCLERLHRYTEVVDLLDGAITDDIPGADSLRRRRERCSARTGNPLPPAPAHHAQVTNSPYTVAFDVTVKPRPRAAVIGDRAIICLVGTGDAARIVWLDRSTGEELRRSGPMGRLDRIIPGSDGRAMAVRKDGRIGAATTRLVFLSAAGTIDGEHSVPDAISEIAQADEQWYVGCRDGWLYAFSTAARPLWRWQLPESIDSLEPPSMRPCPYLVDAGGGCVATSSFKRLYVLRTDGSVAWKATLPPGAAETRRAFRPLAAPQPMHEAYEILGVRPPVTTDELKSAFRRRARETHPDTNLSDPQATAKFVAVQRAYEMALTIPPGGSMHQGPSIEVNASAYGGIRIELNGFNPICSLSVHAGWVVAGTYGGRLYRYDPQGKLVELLALGGSMVSATVDHDGRVAGAWCDEMLWLFADGKPASATPWPHWAPRLYQLANNDVVAWDRQTNTVSILGPLGATRQQLRFTAKVAAVGGDTDTVMVLAETILALRTT